MVGLVVLFCDHWGFEVCGGFVARSFFELLVGHCVGCFCLFVGVGGPGCRCVVPVGSWVCRGVAVFVVARCGCLAFGVLFAVRVGVALFGWGVVCRAVPHSQLVGFRRGVYYFSCALFVAAGCVARDVLFGVRACAFASSVRGGQGTCAHELYESPARKQG